MQKDRPTVPDAKPFVDHIYLRHAAGCCWHVVLDDGNVDDDTVRYCAGAFEEGHWDCAVLAVMLPRMTRTQRLKLHNLPKPETRGVH